MRSVVLIIGLVLAGCSSDDDGKSCDELAEKIRVVAERDGDLQNYQGYDRTGNPCAEPIPITASTDYRPACAELKICLGDL